MNLWLITYDGDLTQFVVDAEDKDSAIEKAIQANKSNILGEISDEDMEAVINDKYVYSWEKIDWNLLKEIFARKDYLGEDFDVVIFND